jgi:hypothetical protein
MWGCTDLVTTEQCKTSFILHKFYENRLIEWNLHVDFDKICMMMTRLACNRAIESSYWRMDNDSDVGLLMGYVLYWLPIELESMDLDTKSPCRFWQDLHDDDKTCMQSSYWELILENGQWLGCWITDGLCALLVTNWTGIHGFGYRISM